MARLTQITSRSNPLLARLRKLAGDSGAYRKLGAVLLEGEHLCAAWQAKGGAVPQAVVSEAAWADPGLRALAAAAVEVAVVSSAAMEGFGRLDSPASIAFVVPLPSAEAVLPDVPTVVLDRIQDPGNVGAILRSAAAFGAAQVIALVGTAGLWSPKVVRAGMGAHFGLRLIEGVDGARLAELAVPMFGTSSHAGQRVDSFALAWPCAWAFGHEGQGLAPDVSARCRAMLAIAQPGGEESLNVGAAAAICLYESARRRT